MQKTHFNVYSFLQFQYVRAAMHRITSLELLGTLIAGLEQNKQINRFEPTFAENLLFQWEKVDNAILRVKLEYMKEAYCSWN